MGNRSKFSSGNKQQQKLDYRPSNMSTSQAATTSGSRRESRQFVSDQGGSPGPLLDKWPDSQLAQLEPTLLDGSSPTTSGAHFERENPTKITHGFWLQQYTWLHNDNSLGGGGGSGDTSAAVTAKMHRVTADNLSPLPAPQPQIPAQRQALTSRRQRLLHRWNNLVRTFGGSHSDNLASSAHDTKKATNRSLFAAATGAEADIEGQEQRLPVATSSAPSTAHSTLAKSSLGDSSKRQQQQQHQDKHHDHQRQTFKWTSPSRWRPASSGSRQSAVQNETTACNEDDGVANTPDSARVRVAAGCDRKRRWFTRKPLSNSASTLMSPPMAISVSQHYKETEAKTTEQAKTMQQQQQQQYQEPSGRLELPGDSSVEPEVEVRSKSSCELGKRLDDYGDGESSSYSPNKHLTSPYRQICRALASKSPTRRRRKKQQQLADSTDKLPVPSSSQQRSGSSESASKAHKRSRLMQFAFPSERRDELASSGRHQSPKLFGGLFVSPLFRRGEISDSKVEEVEKGVQVTGERRDLKLIAGDKSSEKAHCATFTTTTTTTNKKHESATTIRRSDEIASCSNGSNFAATFKGENKRDLELELSTGVGRQLQGAPRGVGYYSTQTAQEKATEVAERSRRKVEVCSQVDESLPEQPMQQVLSSSGVWEQDKERQTSEMERLTDDEKSGDGSCKASGAQSGPSSEFKFQLERGDYYANETKVVAAAAAEGEETGQAKCLYDDHGQVIRWPAVESRSQREPKRDLGPGKGPEGKVAEVAHSKRVKVIHDKDEMTETKLVFPLDVSCDKKRKEDEKVPVNHSNGFGGRQQVVQIERDGIEFKQEYQAGDGYDRSGRQDMEQDNNRQCQEDERRNLTTGGGRRMRASKTEEAIANDNDDDDDDDDDDLRSSNEDNVGHHHHHQQQQKHHKLRAAERSLLPLIQPLASSSSSFSSICFDSTSQHNHESDNEQQQQSSKLPENNQQTATPAATKSAPPRPDRPPERPASTPVIATKTNPDTSGHPSGNRQKVGHAPSSGVGLLKTNFKKLVKRQQSVDSYRMARDLKNKLKRQHEGRNKHQSNEAIKTKSVGDEKHPTESVGGGRRKFSMLTSGGASVKSAGGRTGATGAAVSKVELIDDHELEAGGVKLRICIDPYAKPGSFTLPGEDRMMDNDVQKILDSKVSSKEEEPKAISTSSKLRVTPTPPNTLSLMPQQPGAFIVGSFSGCITPTYPTHHLPSPKYGPPVSSKKYSNASTISSSLGGDVSHATNYSLAANSPGAQYHHQLRLSGDQLISATTMAATSGALTSGTATNPSDTESSLGGASNTPSKQATAGGLGNSMSQSNKPSMAGLVVMDHHSSEFGQLSRTTGTTLSSSALGQMAVDEQEALVAAAAAARRAQLAEHIYDNKCGLGEDMKFLASLPELCDITFLVGETREPVCAVKSVLAARSRVFHKILFGNRGRRIARQQRTTTNNNQEDEQQQQQLINNSTTDMDRRSSSPKQPVSSTLSSSHKPALAAKSSSPMGAASGRNISPNQQQQQQSWSVMADASGYNPTGPPSSVSPVQSNTGDEQKSGRVSVASNGGRDSGISHTSQGSQQPLIIGPGQMAAPAPPSSMNKRNKKSSIRGDGSGAGSRLSRMFMKRASDPSIKQHHHNQLANANHTTQNYLDKMSSSQMSTTMIIEEFEPDVFRQLIEYIHTGCVLLQARTLLGLLNAADYYGLEQLRKACLRFVSCCITVDTVCSLLSTAERYIQYKCTKSIVQKVLEFVDTHADEIFKLNAFGLLPEHVVRLILSRDGLQADEHVKYNGVYTWCEHYCRSYELTNISDVMRNFIDLIQFHRIPTNVLLSEIYPTHVVPDNIFLSALAYQADPLNFEPQPMQTRRMTLPNPTIFKPYEDYNCGQINLDNSDQENEHEINMSQIKISGGDNRKRKSTELQQQKQEHQQQQQARQEVHSGELYSSQQMLPATRGAVRSRKSTGGQPDGASGKASKLRKGSIAQVSISGVMRLSHKLSIKKRASNIVNSATGTAQSRRRIGSIASSSNVLPISGGGKRSVSKQQSAIDGNHTGSRDPMLLGQQILTAYLEQQRQRELELEERKRQEELERLAAEEAKRRSEQGSGEQTGSGASPGGTELQQQQQQQESSHHKQPIVKSSSTRKSFKDFRHISRRIFMRHSSSKMLQQQHSSASSTTTTTTTTAAASPLVATTSASITAAGQQQQQQQLLDRDKDKDKDKSVGVKAKRRNMLKIKRSETVFETTTTSTTSGAQMAG